MPHVSVVIPTYNAAATLGEAIRCALDQTLADKEIIVVDDGSTDATPELLAELGPAIRVIRKANGGVSTARNEGIAAARGEYIALLDSDDTWELDKLERQAAVLDADPGIGLSHCGVYVCDEELRILDEMPARVYDDYCEALLLYSSVVHCSSSTAMIRRDVLEQIGGYDPRFSQCADWDMLLRASLVTGFAPVHAPLMRYRRAPYNMSRNIPLLERDTFGVLDRFYSEDVPARYRAIRGRVYSNHWSIVSGCYLHAGRPRDAARCAVRSVRAWPANVRRPLGLPGRWVRRRLRAARS